MNTSSATFRSRPNPLVWALAGALGISSTSVPSAPLSHSIGVLGVAAQTVPPAKAQNSILWSVTNCNDAGPGSLRSVAAQAVDGDGIDMSGLTCSTISLTSGAITLHDVELTGPGAAALTVDGSGNQGQRIFRHAGSDSGGLTIRGITVHGAKYQSNAGQGGACLQSDTGALRIHDSVFDGCIAFAPSGTNGYVRGGAIAAYGDYTLLSNVTLSNNQVRSANGNALGGALYMHGSSLEIDSSTITNNSATTATGTTHARGGGVFTRGWAGIFDSTIDGNFSEGPGGGALIEAGGMLVTSTVSGNVATGGASGIAFLGTHQAMAGVYSSTISGNETQASTQWGSGGLYMNTAPATIVNSTIAGNIESNTQGIAHGAGIMFGPATGNYLTMISTIVFGNHILDFPSGADIGGPLGITIGGDHNLIGVALVYTPVDTLHDSPNLGPLQDNGGPTWTRMPAADGAAIDHGNDNGRDADQRGFPRVFGAAADIGAVETGIDMIFANGFE